MKKLFIFLLLIPIVIQAQNINVGLGTNSSNPSFQIDFGYIDKVMIVGSYQTIPVKSTEIMFYYGIKIGYRVLNFTPQIGYFLSRYKDDMLAYFLKYNFELNRIEDRASLYVEAGYLNKPQLIAGFQINITK